MSTEHIEREIRRMEDRLQGMREHLALKQAEEAAKVDPYPTGTVLISDDRGDVTLFAVKLGSVCPNSSSHYYPQTGEPIWVAFYDADFSGGTYKTYAKLVEDYAGFRSFRVLHKPA